METKSEIEKVVTKEEAFPEQQADALSKSFEEFSSLSEENAVKKLSSVAQASFEVQDRIRRNLPVLLDRISPEAMVPALPNIFAKSLEGATQVQLDIASAILSRLESETFQEKPKEFDAICVGILNFLEPLLDPTVNHLSRRAEELVVNVAKVVQLSIADDHLLRLVLNMLHETGNDLLRIAALRILPHVYKKFSKEMFEGFLATEIVALSKDPRSELRLAAFKAFFEIEENIERINTIFEKKFFQVISQMYDDPSNDVKVLFVSKICLIAKKYPFYKLDKKQEDKSDENFEENFFVWFFKSLESKNRFVKEEALTKIGELIITLSSLNDSFNKIFMDNFLKLYDKYFELPKILQTNKVTNLVKKTVMKANCSYLSQIMKIRSEGNWERLKVLLQGVEEFDAQIIEAPKLEIARQLSNLALVPEQKQFENEFLVTLNRHYLTIGNKVSEKVKLASLKQLAKVLDRLDMRRRDYYAGFFYETMSTDVKKWRVRYTVAQQIGEIATLFSSDTFQEKILPMYFSFCRDPVATVRTISTRKVFLILPALKTQVLNDMFWVNLREYGMYRSYTTREAFVVMFQQIFFNQEKLLSEDFWKILVNLASDKVINVRIQIAMFLKDIYTHFKTEGKLKEIISKKFSSHEKNFNEIISKLEEVSDSDVSSILFEITGEDRYNKKPKPATVVPLLRRSSRTSSQGSLHSSFDESKSATENTILHELESHATQTDLRNHQDLITSKEHTDKIVQTDEKHIESADKPSKAIETHVEAIAKKEEIPHPPNKEEQQVKVDTPKEPVVPEFITDDDFVAEKAKEKPPSNVNTDLQKPAEIQSTQIHKEGETKADSVEVQKEIQNPNLEQKPKLEYLDDFGDVSELSAQHKPAEGSSNEEKPKAELKDTDQEKDSFI